GLGVFYAGHPCYGRPGDKTLKHACVHKCEMLGSPCDDDEIAEFLKRMFNSSGDYEEVHWSVQEALSELRHTWVREPSISNADLIVCDSLRTLCCADGTGEAAEQGRVLVACNFFAASQCLYQTGVSLRVRLSNEWRTTCHLGWFGKVKKQIIGQRPREIASYRATVLVPNDLTVFAFIEVYALRHGMLHSCLVLVAKRIFLHSCSGSKHLSFTPDRMRGAQKRAHDLILLASPAMKVQQFSSIPELIELAATVDLDTISRGMGEHLAQLRTTALNFWTATLQRLQHVQKDDGKVETFQENLALERLGPTRPMAAMAAVLDCSSDEHGAWNAFRRAFQSNAASGFMIDWKLQADLISLGVSGEVVFEKAEVLQTVMAKALWDASSADPDTLAAASALFHQVLIGAAPLDLVRTARYCHYGLVAALYVLARHSLVSPQGSWESQHYTGLAMRFLGGSGALDFLEDSAWPLSSLDIACLQISSLSCQAGECAMGRCLDYTRTRTAVESLVPWTIRQDMLLREPVRAPTTSLSGVWKLAVVGAHPSLCADIATAVHAALNGRSQLGQCQNDLIFERILSRMMNWAEFEEMDYSEEVLRHELQAIVELEVFLLQADVQVCTGPYILCYMLQQVLKAPTVVYGGLALTYLASPETLEPLLQSAQATALSHSGLSDSVVLVVTDLMRAAQFHHATGIWVPAVPPLSFYQEATHSGHVTSHPRAVALRPELWRRATFGPAFRGLLRQILPGPNAVVFQAHYLPLRTLLSHDAALMIPWDNDVMSFFEIYHAAMPLILPSPKLMAKWLPAVRWGSLEYDRSTASGIPMCMVALEQGKQGHKRQAPWMNQSSLAAALEEQALGWIGATDYYRLPHVLHFDSVASIGTLLQQSLLRETSWRMKIWSRRIRAHSVAFYQHVLVHLFGGQSLEKSLLRQNGAEATTWHAWSGDSWHQLPQGGTCRDGFITQEDFPQVDPAISANLRLRKCLELCDETAGCKVAAFNGLTCMVYDESCDSSDLRGEGSFCLPVQCCLPVSVRHITAFRCDEHRPSKLYNKAVQSLDLGFAAIAFAFIAAGVLQLPDTAATAATAAAAAAAADAAAAS
ncbi:unnamed protein product, partial [Symbiodinium pilosum]